MTTKVTKTEEFKSLEELKVRLKSDEKNINSMMNEYQSFVRQALGPMPKTQLQMVEFVEKILKFHELIK